MKYDPIHRLELDTLQCFSSMSWPFYPFSHTGFASIGKTVTEIKKFTLWGFYERHTLVLSTVIPCVIIS